MQWRERRRSTNVEDARGQRMAGGGGGAGLAVLLNLALRALGPKGLLVLAVVGVVAWQAGLIDPAAVVGGGGELREVEDRPSAEEQALFEFVQVVLADTEDVWTRELARVGRRYVEPELVVYRERYPTGCGVGEAAMGPFYCPADQKVYIDLGFYDELARQLDAPGDFAQAYVIAHEVGHHVQNLLGTFAEVDAHRGGPDANQWSVRLELQADFLAGVWAHHNRRYLDPGDIEEAMRAANRIGDDALQRRAQGRVVPHAFTHGTSAQRTRWFERGLRSGRVEDGDTFSPRYEEL